MDNLTITYFLNSLGYFSIPAIKFQLITEILNYNTIFFALPVIVILLLTLLYVIVLVGNILKINIDVTANIIYKGVILTIFMTSAIAILGIIPSFIGLSFSEVVTLTLTPIKIIGNQCFWIFEHTILAGKEEGFYFLDGEGEGEDYVFLAINVFVFMRRSLKNKKKHEQEQGIKKQKFLQTLQTKAKRGIRKLYFFHIKGKKWTFFITLTLLLSATSALSLVNFIFWAYWIFVFFPLIKNFFDNKVKTILVQFILNNSTIVTIFDKIASYFGVTNEQNPTIPYAIFKILFDNGTLLILWGVILKLIPWTFGIMAILFISAFFTISFSILARYSKKEKEQREIEELCLHCVSNLIGFGIIAAIKLISIFDWNIIVKISKVLGEIILTLFPITYVEALTPESENIIDSCIKTKQDQIKRILVQRYGEHFENRFITKLSLGEQEYIHSLIKDITLLKHLKTISTLDYIPHFMLKLFGTCIGAKTEKELNKDRTLVQKCFLLKLQEMPFEEAKTIEEIVTKLNKVMYYKYLTNIFFNAENKLKAQKLYKKDISKVLIVMIEHINNKNKEALNNFNNNNFNKFKIPYNNKMYLDSELSQLEQRVLSMEHPEFFNIENFLKQISKSSLYFKLNAILNTKFLSDQDKAIVKGNLKYIVLKSLEKTYEAYKATYSNPFYKFTSKSKIIINFEVNLFDGLWQIAYGFGDFKSFVFFFNSPVSAYEIYDIFLLEQEWAKKLNIELSINDLINKNHLNIPFYNLTIYQENHAKCIAFHQYMLTFWKTADRVQAEEAFKFNYIKELKLILKIKD